MSRRQAEREQLLRERIGRNVAKARGAAGLSQEALADEMRRLDPDLRTDRVQVSGWERGRTRPNDLSLEAIADATDCPLGWFLDEHDGDPPSVDGHAPAP
jgi:transcriptional regulator with XRE-family HTH domain